MAKTTRKSTTSKNALSKWQKIVPKTPRAKFVTFLIVFAVMGGGVMAYRSFAAVSGVFFGADKLTAVNESGQSSIIFDSVNSKGDTKSWQLVAGTNPAQGNVNRLYNAQSVPLWARQVRACATLRSPNGQLAHLHLYHNSDAVSDELWFSTTSKTYTKYCASWVAHATDPNRGYQVFLAMPAKFNVFQTNAPYVYVNNLSFEIQ